MAFQEGFDYGFQGVPLTVDLPVATLEIEPLLPRPIVVNQPLIGLSERYLVIGQRIDLNRRRVTQICEQIVYSPFVIVALVMDERWDMDLGNPLLLLIDEGWEGEFLSPEVLVTEELWNS